MLAPESLRVLPSEGDLTAFVHRVGIGFDFTKPFLIDVALRAVGTRSVILAGHIVNHVLLNLTKGRGHQPKGITRMQDFPAHTSVGDVERGLVIELTVDV